MNELPRGNASRKWQPLDLKLVVWITAFKNLTTTAKEFTEKTYSVGTGKFNVLILYSSPDIQPWPHLTTARGHLSFGPREHY